MSLQKNKNCSFYYQTFNQKKVIKNHKNNYEKKSRKKSRNHENNQKNQKITHKIESKNLVHNFRSTLPLAFNKKLSEKE